MINKSRRRIKMAAGAILASAAIPIAAAGAAWADTPDQNQTETASQLEHQGLTKAEAQTVVTAEGNGTAVLVSYDGTTVVNANNSGDEASATSGTVHDVAAAIGQGSIADAGAGTDQCARCDPTAFGASLNGSHDTAFANGNLATAYSGDGNKDTAIAIGDYNEASAAVGNDDKTTVSGGTYSTAQTGGVITDGGATLRAGDHDKAIVKGDYSSATAGGAFDRDKAEALGSNLTAQADQSNGQTDVVRPGEATPLIDAHVMPMP
jgi:hypothetical protein